MCDNQDFIETEQLKAYSRVLSKKCTGKCKKTKQKNIAGLKRLHINQIMFYLGLPDFVNTLGMFQVKQIAVYLMVLKMILQDHRTRFYNCEVSIKVDSFSSQNTI